MSATILTEDTTTISVSAVDEAGHAFTGAVPTIKVTSDNPCVEASVGPVINGIAKLTLVRKGAGIANIILTSGSISVSHQVQTYVPTFANLTIGA